MRVDAARKGLARSTQRPYTAQPRNSTRALFLHFGSLSFVLGSMFLLRSFCKRTENQNAQKNKTTTVALSLFGAGIDLTRMNEAHPVSSCLARRASDSVTRVRLSSISRIARTDVKRIDVEQAPSL